MLYLLLVHHVYMKKATRVSNNRRRPLRLCSDGAEAINTVHDSNSEVGCGKINFLFPEVASISYFYSLIYSMVLQFDLIQLSTPLVSIWFSILSPLSLVHNEGTPMVQKSQDSYLYLLLVS
jgi:hypothetical protein